MEVLDFKIIATVFLSVFLAELGDKTQICTVLFASKTDVSGWTVFIGASLALIATSAIGVLTGCTISQYLNPKYLHYLAGTGFILIGIWTLYKA